MDFAAFVAKTAQAQGIRIAPVDAARSALGAAGWIRFRAKPANLNYGDSYAYALAIDLDAPILCKGEDVINTHARVLRPPTQN
jgi:ribonuclease VapC